MNMSPLQAGGMHFSHVAQQTLLLDVPTVPLCLERGVCAVSGHWGPLIAARQSACPGASWACGASMGCRRAKLGKCATRQGGRQR